MSTLEAFNTFAILQVYLLVAGPGFAPGFRDYEPRVVTTPPPRGNKVHTFYITLSLF